LIHKNRSLLFNLSTSIFLPLFPLYTDGGIFSIYSDTDGYHTEFYENCISNIFFANNAKPFYLVDFRDVNTLAAIYYNLTSEDFYLRLRNYSFSNKINYIEKYKNHNKKFFEIFFNNSKGKYHNNPCCGNKDINNFGDRIYDNFCQYNYFLFLFHNNIGPLYNDKEIFLEEENFFGLNNNSCNVRDFESDNDRQPKNENKIEDLEKIENKNILKNNKEFIKGIEFFRSLGDKVDSENIYSKNITNYKNNHLNFILKKLHLVSLKKGVKFIIWISSDNNFINESKCDEKIKLHLYEEYNQFFEDNYKTKVNDKNSDLNNICKMANDLKITTDINSLENFDVKKIKYSNKLEFQNLPGKEYNLDFSKLKENKEICLRIKEEKSVRFVEFNLDCHIIKNKKLKPFIYIEINEDSNFYALNISQYFIARFINIQEIRGITPYNKNLININYKEALEFLIEKGLWIDSWELTTIPKIIPFGSLIDL